MMESIAAGESFSGACPPGMKADLREGQLLPSAEKASVKVLKVEGETFVLGPMKAGQILVNVPCDITYQSVSFIVNEMPAEAALNRYSPLRSERVEYPFTIYILIAAIVLSPLLGFLAYKFRKKKISFKKAVAVNIKRDSRVLLEEEISFLQKNVHLPESHHFHKLYKRLRKFIEAELNLKTKALTTQEFLGTFRALALQQSTNQALISQLEYVLRTADDVRFAGKAFTAELWTDYLQKTQSVVAAFPKKVEAVKKK